MNLDGLEKTYWEAQITRVQDLRARIASRAAVAPGRVVPEQTDLVIGTGRRLDAAIMFTDISGFSSRNAVSSDEQEMMVRVLNLYFSVMVGIAEDYGGFIEKNTGDGLMAYFEAKPAGDPGANPTKRALSCALTMDAVNLYLVEPILRASGIPPIQYRTSIEYGPITIARLGTRQGFNANVAVGNAANFAAKMLSLLRPAEIGLGAAAYDQVPLDWRYLYAQLSDVNTGWVYTGTSAPYPLYLYTGRWARVI